MTERADREVCKRQAADLREQIDELVQGKRPGRPRSPREFVEREMRHRERRQREQADDEREQDRGSK